MQVYCNVGVNRRLGIVVNDSYYTCWVKIMIGAKSYIIIKRHKRKHKVWYV